MIGAVRPVIDALEKLHAKYFVTGSVASSSAGVPRSTLDIDLVTVLESKSVDEFVTCIGEDFYSDKESILSAIRDRRSFNLVHIPTALKIDVFILKGRAYDHQTLIRRQSIRFGSAKDAIELYFASPEDVILSKLEWYRSGGEVSGKQWHDILGVLKVQKGQLDLDYLEKWARDLAVKDLLDRAQTASI